jgi:hypothetical protein
MMVYVKPLTVAPGFPTGRSGMMAHKRVHRGYSHVELANRKRSLGILLK